MSDYIFEKFKNEFRDLYGSFSPDEIVVNHRLVQLVEEIEAIIRHNTSIYLH